LGTVSGGDGARSLFQRYARVPARIPVAKFTNGHGATGDDFNGKGDGLGTPLGAEPLHRAQQPPAAYVGGFQRGKQSLPGLTCQGRYGIFQASVQDFVLTAFRTPFGRSVTFLKPSS
jgi:hypothetical protein